MKVGELFFELGFQTDTVKVNDFINMIGKLNINSILASLGVKELYDGLKDIMTIADTTATGMNLFGKETGLSAQKMQQWTKYAEQLGVSGDTVTGALTTLQKKAAGLKSGLDSSLLTPLYILNQAGAGITDKDLDNPFVFLEKALKGLQKVNPELRTTVAGMLGISEQLLAMKSFQGADAIPVPSADQVATLMQYHKIWTQLSQNVGMFFIDLASQWAPELQSFGSFLNDIIKYVTQNIVQFKAWGEVLVGIASFFIPLLRVPYVLSMIATHFKQISDEARSAWEWMDKISRIISPGRVAENLTNGALILGHNATQAVGGAAKSIEQNIVMHITGHNAHDIAKAVDDRLNKHLSDAQYQSPLTQR